MDLKSKADFLGIVTGGIVLVKLLVKNLDVTMVLAIVSVISFCIAGIAGLCEKKKGAK